MFKRSTVALHLGRLVAAGGIAALVLATVAFGANGGLGGGARSGATSLDRSNDSSGTVTSVDLPAAASAVANEVLTAITGGTNPSTVVAKDEDKGQSTEHAAVTTNTNVTTAKSDKDRAENETEDNDVSETEEVGQAGTTSTRPGFGCGDKNHEHSGPPGRPGATPPPGCTKHHDR